ncbi:hypothetical protein EGW08_023393, partial [Elysia chlorotica]
YAVTLGVMGFDPETVDIELAKQLYQDCISGGVLKLNQTHNISFDHDKDIKFHYDEFLPEHANGMKFSLINGESLLAEKIYFSVGGGFILDKSEMAKDHIPKKIVCYKPHIFKSMKELREICESFDKSIDEIMLENEVEIYGDIVATEKLNLIWQVMNQSINAGLSAAPGVLPGGLSVRKRAPSMLEKLQLHNVIKSDFNYLNAYAIAVNEQNACGERIVTSPTNGAAGIVPAVLRYFLENNQLSQIQQEHVIHKYLLITAAIGILYKSGASISAAEVGCQGEVGVACSMAAAGYCALLGGDLDSIESAAEIAMEHNLGLTCDPIGGLVEIPCIERNAMGAVQAINAAKLAYLDTGDKRFIGLDYVIKVMYETGLDMNTKYKETSLGGLAANISIC